MKTYELVTGRTPFEADFDDHDLIPQFQAVVGGIPAEWVPDAIREGVLKETPNSWLIPRPHSYFQLTI